MTTDRFRASAERVGRMKELLSDPVLALAIVCLRDSELPEDVTDHSDPVASVRVLSRKSGWHGAITELLSLAEPLPLQQANEEATYGVDKRQFNLDITH